MDSNLVFSFDLSGQPPGDTHFACVCYDMDYCSDFFTNFKKQFKHSFHKKGKQLDEETLCKMLEFLDDHQIRSYCASYYKNNWDIVFRSIPEKKGYKIDKICGIVYFILLNINTNPHYPYTIHVCKESFLDIDTVIGTCKDIAKMRGKNFNFAVGTDKQNDYIKISDFVASATRKIKLEKLKSYRFYNHNKAHISNDYRVKAFNLYEKKKK